ncbi:hypothetical protein GCM10011409_45350 [Lentibacillus populi]|uniref:Uncharacterized protein n=1 Tax=Lentibacillus populi TaxID=1827502 RepID=A0A9W5U2Q9_9BACI|nr:hypothetical protein [Lentibacillus populi]GGB63194.1 hypothetical protein GCM10011409_45350 [Lentibacillus populi]
MSNYGYCFRDDNFNADECNCLFIEDEGTEKLLELLNTLKDGNTVT